MFSTIGYEVELDLCGGDSNDFFKNYTYSHNWEREYYDFQVERNNFLFNINDLKDLYNVISYMKTTVINEIEHIAIDTGYSMPMNSLYSKMCSGLISNGVHIHLGGDEFISQFFKYANENELYIGRVFNKFREFIIRTYIDIFGISGRFAFSHHVWGYYRNSIYEYKQKSKFRPALYRHEHKTFELRLFNLEDIFDIVKMREFLKRIYNFKVKKIEKVRKSRVQSRLESVNSEFDSSWIEFYEKEKNRFKDSIYINDYKFKIIQKNNVIYYSKENNKIQNYTHDYSIVFYL